MDPKPKSKAKRRATRRSDLEQVVAQFQLLRVRIDGLTVAWRTQLAEMEAKLDALIAFTTQPYERDEKSNGTLPHRRADLFD